MCWLYQLPTKKTPRLPWRSKNNEYRLSRLTTETAKTFRQELLWKLLSIYKTFKNCCSGEKEVVLLIDNNCILAESVVEWNDLNDYENSTSHARRFWSQSCNLYLVCFKLEDNSKGRVPYCLIWIWTCDRVNFSSQFYTTRPQLSGITKKQH